MGYNPSDFPHLTEDEWAIVERMVQSLGPRAVEVVLTTLSEPKQHASLANANSELRSPRRKSLAAKPKLHASWWKRRVSKLLTLYGNPRDCNSNWHSC